MKAPKLQKTDDTDKMRKLIYKKFVNDAGGFGGARSSIKIPDNYTQIYDILHKHKHNKKLNDEDELIKILGMSNN